MISWLALLLATIELQLLVVHFKHHICCTVEFIIIVKASMFNFCKCWIKLSLFVFLYDFYEFSWLSFPLSYWIKKLQLKLSWTSRNFTVWLDTGKAIHVSQVNTHGMVWTAVTTIIQGSSHCECTSKTSKLLLTHAVIFQSIYHLIGKNPP